jgi:cytochrome P450 / NADPH-cytochrome P450 reductase
VEVIVHTVTRKLKYLDACMKEALRMQHPVSLLTRFATKDTVLGGKYFIRTGQMVSGIWRHFHRDPKVWGEDADEFRPERMLDVNFQALPPDSWKPVSTHIVQATNLNLHPFPIVCLLERRVCQCDQ